MRLTIVGVIALLALSCSKGQPESEPASATLPPLPWKGAAIAHGGVGSPPERTDGTRAAVDAALAVLEKTGDPLEAAVAGVVVLEDDPRFNAGIGSRVRIDGTTVQMDAAVMTSTGTFGAVAIIEHTKNPILVARAVADTPHNLLAGEGATRFARTLGMEPYNLATDAAQAKTAAIVAKLRAADPSLGKDWQKFDWRKHWNFERTLSEAGLTPSEVGTDTVGVAVRAADGRFAVALSTGGTAITLRGRVGDVPILGAGLFAGAHAAVAATGKGERIVEATLSRRVHQWVEQGVDLQTALERAVAELRGKGSIGLIAVTATDLASAADRAMAWSARELGSTTWLGTLAD